MRKYPAIHPLESWSKYKSVLRNDWVDFARYYIFRGNEVEQMMKVVGEEGTSLEDFIIYLKGEFLDAVYLQQNSFDEIDSSVLVERQEYIFKILMKILGSSFDLSTKDEARSYFNQLRQKFLDWNYTTWNTDAFKKGEVELVNLYNDKSGTIDTKVEVLLKDGE